MATSSTSEPSNNAEREASSAQISNLSDTQLQIEIKNNSKWKQRSEETTFNTHFLELAEAAADQYTILLIGSSMLERFKTTGHDLCLGIKSNIFKAGVGGDTIPNVLYRIDSGLLLKAKSQTRLRTIIVNIGSNDLKKRGRSLSKIQLYQFSLMLEILRRAFPHSRIMVTALFHKTDVDLADIDQSNHDLKKEIEGVERVEWLEAPIVDLEMHYEDHVHLNRAGYQTWDVWLVEKLGL